MAVQFADKALDAWLDVKIKALDAWLDAETKEIGGNGDLPFEMVDFEMVDHEMVDLEMVDYVAGYLDALKNTKKQLAEFWGASLA